MPLAPAPRPAVVLRAAVLAAVALAAALPAQRQPGGVAIRKLSGEFGLELETRDEKSRSGIGAGVEQHERLLRESLGLRAMGDIYHPALFDFDAGVRLDLDQRDLDGGDGTTRQWSNTATVYYDATADILKEKSISGDIYGRKGRLDTRQRFFATTTADSTDYGGNLRFKEIWIPSTLHYENTSYVGHGGDRLRQSKELWRLQGMRNRDGTSIDYQIDRGFVDQDTYNVNYDELTARANVTHRFLREHSVRVGGYYREQTGDISSTYEQANAGLHLQWLENLYSELDVLVDRTELATGDAATQKSLDLSGGLFHQLYESLDTGILGRMNRTEFGAGHVYRDQGDLVLGYHKKAVFGALGANYHPYLYRQEEVGAAERAPVVDESLLYLAGVPLFLRFPGADPTTVVVTDVTATVLYVEPADYVLTQINGRVRLDIPVGSRINVGDTLLVDYVYDPSPDRTFRGVGQNVSVQFEFGHFAVLSLEHANERHEILTGFDDGTLGNTRMYAARGRLYQWDQELSADYEDWETPYSPYQRTQVMALSRLALGDDTQLASTARWYRTRFKEGEGRDHGISIGSHLEWHVSNPTTLFARGEYHDVTYRTDQGTGWMLETGVDYRVRKRTVTAEVRYTSERFEVASDQDLLFFQFVFRQFF